MSLHLPLLLAYSVLLVALGLWMGRRVRRAGDFFVAGRQLGPGLLFATMLAANLGAGSTVGAAGLGYRDGAGAWWWVGSAGLGSLVLAFAVGPRIWREASAHGFHTVGDYLERRFSPAVKGLIAGLLWLGTLAILAGQLIALAWLLQVVAGLPKVVGCLVGGLVMTTYFVAGGLLTSAWVNLVQLVVLLGGFAIALTGTLGAVGGWDGLAPRLTTAPPDYLAFWRGGQSGWPYLLLLGPAFIVSPGLLQKVYGARDARAVRLGVGANAAALLVFAAVPPLLGMIARGLHPGLPNHELALPALLTYDLPPLVGSIGLAALFSAEVSTADAILFMLATSLSQDLYRGFVNRQATDAQLLRAARSAAVAGAALGVALAVVSPSIIDTLKVFYTLLGVCLFVPILGGLFVPRLDTAGALAGILAGVAATAAAQWGAAGAWAGALGPVAAGLATSVTAAAVVSLRPR